MFDVPVGISVDVKRRLIRVADVKNNRVHVLDLFSSDATPPSSRERRAMGSGGEFSYPKSAAAELSSDILYVHLQHGQQPRT